MPHTPDSPGFDYWNTQPLAPLDPAAGRHDPWTTGVAPIETANRNPDSWVWDEPAQAPAQLPDYLPQNDKTRWRDRVSMKVVALGTAAAVAAGIGVAGAAAMEGRAGQRVAHRTEATPLPNISPLTAPIPSAVRNDFESALAVDSCETKVTLPEVTDMYQKLFGTSERPNLSFDSLQRRTNDVTHKVEQDRADQGFVPLPDNFEALYNDANISGNKLPISVYQKAATDYFSKFNIQTLFNWGEAPVKGGPLEANMGTVANYASPLTSQELDANPLSRSRIVDAMLSFSSLPPSLIQHKNKNGMQAVTAVAFGNLYEKNDLGITIWDTGIMILDLTKATNLPAEQLLGEEEYDKTTAPHEVTHEMMNNICGTMIRVVNNRATIEDPAFISLNKGFSYGQSSIDTLARDKPVAQQFVALHSPANGKVAVAREYGATDSAEDSATLLGENILYPQGIATLETDNRDVTIVREKVALDLARLAKNAPEAAQYFIDQFAAVRVQNAIHAAGNPAKQRLENYVDSRFAQGFTDFPSDATYNKLKAAAQPYENLNSLIDKAVNHTQFKHTATNKK